MNHVIPFSLSPEDVEKIVYRYLATSNVSDDAFFTVRFLKKEALFLPAFRYHIDYQVDWSVTFGFEKEEEYTDFREERGKSVRYKAKRKVIDWKPERGRSHGELNTGVYAGNVYIEKGTSPYSIVPYAINHGTITPSEETAEYAIDSEHGFSLLEREIADHMNACVQSNAQGKFQKDWKWVLSNLRTTSEKVLIPIYHIEFEYQGMTYTLYCDGVDGGKIISDQLPINKTQISALKRGYIPLIVAGGGALIHLYFGQGDGWIYLVIALIIACAYGVLRGLSIEAYSQKLKQYAIDAVGKSEDVSFPTPSFLAQSQRDGMILPIIMIVVLVIMFVPSYKAGYYAHKDEIHLRDLGLMPKVPIKTQPKPLKEHQIASLSAMLEAAKASQWKKLPLVSKEIYPEQEESQTVKNVYQEGLRYFNQRRLQSAREAFLTVLKKDAHHIGAKLYLARTYKAEMDLKTADQYFVDLLKERPHLSVAWGHLAEMYVKADHALIEDAMGALRLAIYFSPDRKKMAQYLKIAELMDDSIAFKKMVSKGLEELPTIPISLTKEEGQSVRVKE